MVDLLLSAAIVALAVLVIKARRENQRLRAQVEIWQKLCAYESDYEEDDDEDQDWS